MKKTRRVAVREGYDMRAETYDERPNPLVAADARYTLDALSPDGRADTRRWLRYRAISP